MTDPKKTHKTVNLIRKDTRRSMRCYANAFIFTFHHISFSYANQQPQPLSNIYIIPISEYILHFQKPHRAHHTVSAFPLCRQSDINAFLIIPRPKYAPSWDIYAPHPTSFRRLYDATRRQCCQMILKVLFYADRQKDNADERSQWYTLYWHIGVQIKEYSALRFIYKGDFRMAMMLSPLFFLYTQYSEFIKQNSNKKLCTAPRSGWMGTLNTEANRKVFFIYLNE